MKNTVKFGTLMIVILVTILCSLILMLLAFSTATMDRRMANRYALAVSDGYDIEALGQEWLANADDALAKDPQADLVEAGTEPDGASSFSIVNDGSGTYAVKIGGSDERHLEIEINVDGSGKYEITKWALTSREIQKQKITDLFKVK